MSTAGIDPLEGLKTQSLFQPPNAAGVDDLGRDEFLKLLVTKLANQDPLKPAEDTEFIAQLASFSSLEQLVDLNGRMDLLASGQTDLINSQSFDLIGKDALVEANNELRIKDGQPDALVYAVGAQAQSVTLTVRGADGVAVRTLELDPSPQGRAEVDWDGLDEDGNVLPDGDYQLEISTLTGDGETVPVDLFRSLPIDGVNFSEGFIQLVSADRILDFSTILEIRSDSPS